jgi:serine/threonine protein kinase
MRDLVHQRLGDFEIAHELGRGGMGIVYEARQLSLNRRVALKVLSGGLGLTPKAVQRFRREAEAAARLHHTNIVPVYATGEEDGTHFYAMELIDGPSLDQVIRQLRGNTRRSGPTSTASADADNIPPDLVQTGPYVEGAGISNATAGLSSSSLGSGSSYFDTVARMLAEVADALEYAHQEGVIHRDIKPSNLLLSPAGRLSVNDFGLARMLERPGMTTTGEFVGTPAYMSPEQIAAGRTLLDHRTDIYSLGATLYEMLTLHPPFRGERRDQVLTQILHKEPKAPRKVNAKVPVDLETICLKALEKDPDRRYQTAGAMAEDLRRYVNRFAILARRAGPVQRLIKWVRRRPSVAASLGCLLCAVCVALAFAYRAHQAEQQRLIEKISNAYLTATSGDLKQTDEAIKEIEALGASTGQVRLLRGVVAYFRQDAESAINELEQAVKLLPTSVAARALLAMAYADSGQPERSEELIVAMQHLEPSSPEDYLFKGYAREANEPGQGLANVNEGLQRRDSPLGRALRTIARTNRAIDSGKPEDAEAAMADADVARGMRPDNPMVLFASTYARLTAAALYQQAARPEKRKAVLQEAARDVQALEPYLDQPNPIWMIWQYYYDTDHPEKALEIARRALDRSGGSIAALSCITSLYLQGRFNVALNCLDQRRHADVIGDVSRGFLVAELPDGPRLALDEYNQIARRHPREIGELPQPSYLLLFLGGKDRAQENFRTLRPLFAQSQGWRAFYEATRQFGCGEVSEDQYLAKANASRWQQCYAHALIGLTRLADGDRERARDHFAQAVNTRAIWLFEWNWSVMFHSRLKNDPKWPPWIPVKKP